VIGPFDYPGCVPAEHEDSGPPDEDGDECWCGGANWQCEACWVEFLEACCE
jgi:hypothetical protein